MADKVSRGEAEVSTSRSERSESEVSKWGGIAVLLMGVLLIGCGTKQCIHSHTETILMPMQFGDVTILIPMETDVCDKWEGDKP